jgi:hypothetical protein
MPQPFQHNELQLKQQFLQLARDYYEKASSDDASFQDELAAAVLYMNLADYLAEYLVVGFTEMLVEAMKTYYLGAVSYKPPQGQKFNIDKSIGILERYDFSGKEEIMAELKEVKESRNILAHQMLKLKARDTHKIDDAVNNLRNHTETLVVLIDEVAQDLPPMNLKNFAATSDTRKAK